MTTATGHCPNCFQGPFAIIQEGPELFRVENHTTPGSKARCPQWGPPVDAAFARMEIMKVQARKTPHPFVVFDPDPQVCATCGLLYTEHEESRSPRISPYIDAVWKFLLERGTAEHEGFYGGGWRATPRESSTTQDIREHMKACSIRTTPPNKGKRRKGAIPDWAYSREPEMDELRVFGGTFAEHETYRTALAGNLYCECGDVYGTRWAISDMTVGQIIWHVIKAGELEDE